jgi:hypothetical protein
VRSEEVRRWPRFELQAVERVLSTDLTLQGAIGGVLHGLGRVTVPDEFGRGFAVSIDFSRIGKCGNFLRISGSDYRSR